MSFHYIDYPGNVSVGLWRDGAGEIKFIDEMGLDHLQASIRKIRNDISRLSRSSREPEVIEVLVHLAKQRLAELEREFQSKADA